MLATNLVKADLTAEERLGEIAQILAAGLMRFHARKSSQISADRGESSVDFARHQSGPDDPHSPEVVP